MVNWRSIDPAIIAHHCTETYARYTVYPSLRDIFYRFIDELWPNTKSVYKYLSKWLRDQRLSGKINWRIIRDGAGREFEDNDWSYKTPRQHVSTWLKLFVDCASRYDLPRWLEQPKKVVVICEKEADYPIVKSLVGLDKLNVDTAFARGYSGWRMLFEIAESFKKSEKQPFIIALADFDPSGGEKAQTTGKDLVSFILKAMLKLGVENVDVEKILITKEQIEEFNLPHRPEDAQEIEKLQKDPRFKTWPYGLYRVETAAFRNKAPDAFDKTIKDAVLKHFDQEIHKKIVEQETELQENIDDFFGDQEDLIEELKDNVKEDERLA